MLRAKMWKILRQREGGLIDITFSIGLFNEDGRQTVPPWVLTEEEAFELFGDDIREWPIGIEIPIILRLTELP
jgi:hypothetical protein